MAKPNRKMWKRES